MRLSFSQKILKKADEIQKGAQALRNELVKSDISVEMDRVRI